MFDASSVALAKYFFADAAAGRMDGSDRQTGPMCGQCPDLEVGK